LIDAPIKQLKNNLFVFLSSKVIQKSETKTKILAISSKNVKYIRVSEINRLQPK